MRRLSLAFALLGLAAACARSGLSLVETEAGAGRTPDASAPETSVPDAGTPDKGPTGRLETLCDEYLDALCSFYGECHRMSFRDHAQCTSELDCYGVEALRGAVAEGRVAYDVERVRTCFERIASEPCDTIYLTGSLQNHVPGVAEILAQCPYAITPLQTQGEPCHSDQECVHGYRCIMDFMRTCPGTCERVPGHHEPCRSGDVCYHPQACLDGLCRLLANEGEGCESALDCRGDLDCDASAARCVRVPGQRLGATCVVDFNGAKPAISCAEGLYCDTRYSTEPGTCRTLAAEGEHCVADSSCLPGMLCSYFDVENPVCQEPGEIGRPCSDLGDCRRGLRCGPERYLDSPYGTCAAALGLGDACNIVEGRGECASDLICDPPACARTLFPGDACGELLSHCVRGSCQDGRCVSLRKLGEPCSNSDDCTTRSCTAGRCTDRSVCIDDDSD